MTASRCQFCAGKLEPAQELRYLVETATLDDPTHLNRIRMLPAAANGSPLRVCQACQSGIETHPVRFRMAVERTHARRQLHAGMLAAVGVLSLGWFVTALLGAQRV